MTDQARYSRLILLRHARTDYDRERVPPENPPLDKKTPHTFATVAAVLPADFCWLVSPLDRCRETADKLVEHGARPRALSYDDRLSEQSWGKWHDQPIAEVWKTLEDKPKHNWNFLHPAITPPDGESFLDLIERLRPLCKTFTNDTVIIAHGMVIRALIGLALDLDPACALATSVDPLSVSSLTHINPHIEAHIGDGTDNGTSVHPDKANAGINAEGGAWRLDYLNRVYEA